MKHKDAGSSLEFWLNFEVVYMNLSRDKQFILEFTQWE